MTHEWGYEKECDNELFEFFCLGVASAGLTFGQILAKRELFCNYFHNFDVEKVSKMTKAAILRFEKKLPTGKKKLFLFPEFAKIIIQKKIPFHEK